MKFDSLSGLINNYKDNLNVLIVWLRDNPYPPIYFPSKNTVIFKYRNFQYQANAQYNASHINACKNHFKEVMSKNTMASNERIRKLKEIINQNEIAIKEFIIPEENEQDLTDFKFSVNDRVRVE